MDAYMRHLNELTALHTCFADKPLFLLTKNAKW